MKIPRALTINGKRWRVVRRPLAHRNLDGICLHRPRQIQVDSGLPRAEQEETFMHELLHACLAEIFTKHGRKEETIVRRLSPRLLEALKGLGWVR